MPTAVTRGISRILSNRRYEDYKSMKQAFQYSKVKEIIFEGFQTMTSTAANLEPSDIAVSLIGAEAVVFLSTIADDATQQDKNVWTVYVDNAGIISEAILTVLDDVDSSIPVPLGNLNDYDTCASVAGDVITMTAMVATEDQYAGWYTIGKSGNGDQLGVANLIISNTASGTVPAFTLTDTPDANTATDVICFQQYAYDDFFRVRELYSEVEANDDKTIAVENQAANAWYGIISREMNYIASARHFTQAESVCRTFLGRIKATCANESTDAKKQGNEIQITFSPKASNTSATASDIIVNKVFSIELDWQPCMELAGATDVVIQILTLDNTNVDDIHVEVTYLEVYDINKQKI